MKLAVSKSTVVNHSRQVDYSTKLVAWQFQVTSDTKNSATKLVAWLHVAQRTLQLLNELGYEILHHTVLSFTDYHFLSTTYKSASPETLTRMPSASLSLLELRISVLTEWTDLGLDGRNILFRWQWFDVKKVLTS